MADDAGEHCGHHHIRDESDDEGHRRLALHRFRRKALRRHPWLAERPIPQRSRHISDDCRNCHGPVIDSRECHAGFPRLICFRQSIPAGCALSASPFRPERRHPFVGNALSSTERLLQHRLARGMTDVMVEVTARVSCEAMSMAGELQIRLSTGRLIALANGARISAYELSGGWGERSGVNSAEVSEDPHNPKELRLRNLTARRWIAIMPDGG